ncbi:hypothetical protein VTJ49DRAFT_523 [Mycothermus thermophilus]|uniref:Uncharacterized protein n=1 Tax=Humicola insolens TaxID=85995 RepID=A0ABR3VFB9_HUMIN
MLSLGTGAILALLASGVVNGLAVDTTSPHGKRTDHRHKPKPSICLDPAALQTASYYHGLEDGTPGIRPGLSKSETDRSNFINFCAGRTLTNGQQNRAGSCNGIPMGRIPSVNNMITSIITYPQPGDRVPPRKTFNVTVQTRHLRAGYLVNPSVSYYTAPQDLDENGDIIGHSHISVQEIGSLRTLEPPDPTRFAYFKGIDEPVDENGALHAEVTGGLPPGVYRRGAQDDSTAIKMSDSSLTFLTHHLNLGTPTLARAILTHFARYALGFLAKHQDWSTLVDPDLRQTVLRIRLSLGHKYANWQWTQQPPSIAFNHNDDAARWGQEEYAGYFMPRALTEVHLARKRGESTLPYLPDDGNMEGLVKEIHAKLCMLQSVWIDSDAWVQDRMLRAKLGQTLAAFAQAVVDEEVQAATRGRQIELPLR